jgi:hypothetical protein
MTPRVLLVNPPIYDFSAYDFWLKPYGMLSVAGLLRGQAEFRLFDYMDRSSRLVPAPAAPITQADSRPRPKKYRADKWGRGEFYSVEVERSDVFKDPRYGEEAADGGTGRDARTTMVGVPRHYHRFGIPRAEFQKFLASEELFDVVLIQTLMTYWYPGVREVIADIRARSPQTKIVLGGVYATVCAAHARTLGADLIVDGTDLTPLWNFLKLQPDLNAMPLWDLYERLDTGVQKLADGCPFKCTYCSVPQVYPKFIARPMERSLAEYDFLLERGVENIVFYDDALLYQPEKILVPFLKEVIKRKRQVNFHTPNALNARFISKELASLMVEAGFKIVYLGFESSAYEWQKKTGGKVYSHELGEAIENLVNAGADISNISAYLIMAHPQADQQNVEESMRFASSLGIRVMLSEFSPIPGTPDGEMCRQWIDLDEPLTHNKTAFPFVLLGAQRVNEIKQLARELNGSLQKKDRLRLGANA